MPHLFALALIGSCWLASTAALAEGDDASAEEPRTLPEIEEHFVWVPDRLLAHSLLFDSESGDVLATIDSGTTITPLPPLHARSRGEFYSVEIDYSRGRRGKRIDYVTIYDSTTLAVLGEILLPHPTSESNTSLAHVALLEDDRFLLIYSQFPETLATVVDLESRRVVGHVAIAGCAGLYPVRARRFATLCGNGTTLMVDLDAEGRLARTARSEVFFDVIADPVSMAGAPLLESWIFTTFGGQLQIVDYSGDTPVALPPWPLADEEERAEGWRPGGLQHVAVHAPSKRLFVVMHQGEPGSHKDAGPEIWRYDLEQQAREARMTTPNLAADFLAGLLEFAPDSLAARLLHWATPLPGVHAILVSQDESPVILARNSDIGLVAVIDALSGDFLRNLTEAGITGPTLGAP